MYEAVKDANARKIALVNALADVAVKAAAVRSNTDISKCDELDAALDAALAALDAAAMEVCK